MSADTPLHVLVVDDEEGLRDLLRWELGCAGMNVETAATGADGVKMLMHRKFNVIITDITMPEMDGLKLLDEAKRLSPQTKVIVVTGFSAVETAVYAMRRGAFDFVLKPYDLNDLMLRVQQAAQAFSQCRTCGETGTRQKSDEMAP